MSLNTELLFAFSGLSKQEESFFESQNIFDYIGDTGKLWHKKIAHTLLNGQESFIHPTAKISSQAIIEGHVYIGAHAVVEPGALIKGPCYIGEHAQIRHGAYIRGHVFIGPKAVVGHASEVKGSILLSGAKAAHFAYVGDAILGTDVNLGAGTKLANLKFNATTVSYKDPSSGKILDSGHKKFSAFMGDYSQTGCNSVLSPGTILMPKTIVMSCKHYRGTLLAGIAK